MTFHPAQCSEREPGGYEDCPWCSGVMLNNAYHGKNVVPSTRAEYQALRVAGGDGPAENPGDGSNLRQVAIGMRKRYGWTPTRIGPPGASHPSFAALWGYLTPGHGAVVNGWMGAWGRDSHWRRWDPGFGGGHSVYVSRDDSLQRVWWMNPLAPNSYPGEWMPRAELQRYWDAFFGGALITRIGIVPPDTSTGDDMYEPFGAPQQPSNATAKRATKLYSQADKATGVLSGVSYNIPAGHVKRYAGPLTAAIAVIVHDRDSSVDGKSHLYGKAVDWEVKPNP